MDIERTKQFYRELKQSDLCGCAYCRNYVNEVAKAYPAVTAYLQTLGVVIGELVFRYGNRLLDRHKLLTVN